MEVSCSCGNIDVDQLPSKIGLIIVKCKKCGSVFDYGVRIMEDEKHKVYKQYGEPDDGKDI